MPARELILNNFWQKVFSLVLATLIWVTIDRAYLSEVQFPKPPLRPETSRDIRCPIFIVTSAGARQTFKVDPSEVDVTVSGDRKRVNNLKPEEIKVTVNLVNVDASKLATQDQWPLEPEFPRDVSVVVQTPFVRVTAVNDL